MWIALLAISVLAWSQAGSAWRDAAKYCDAVPALTILFFTAAWCEPCRAVEPILEKFARDNRKDVKLVALDFDRAKREVSQRDVRDIPVVIVLSGEGKLLLRFEGAEPQALESLPSKLERLLKGSEKKKGSEKP